MKNLKMRQAGTGERERLIGIQRRASLVWEDYREALLAHPDAIDLPLEQIAEGHVFVAEADGKVLGFGVVIPRAGGDAELDGLFVEPSAWGRGIGRALVEEGSRLAASRGASVLHVVANPRAVAFYRACGFFECGEAQTRFGPAPMMQRSVGI